MAGQFKNPLPGKDPSIARNNDDWLSGTPGSQARENLVATGQKSPRPGNSPSTPPWQPGAQRETPSPVSVTEQETVKQPSFPGAQNSLHGPGPLPQTPGAYVQGRHGRYGPGAGAPASQSMSQRPQGPAGPQMYAPPTPGRPGIPQGPAASLHGGPPSFPQGFNSFNQANPASSLAGMNAMGAVPAPGTFRPDRPSVGPNSFGDGMMGPGGRRFDGPPAPGKGPDGKKRRKKRRVPIWARVIIGVLLFFLLLGGSAFAYYQVNFAGAVSHITGQQVARAPGEEDPNANLNGGILSGPRINILLLGSDTDQKFQGQYIAQTDIVVTIDPASKTVGMLSIPRDFYIPVPGYGLHKLDEAYGLGGVDLSRRTLLQDFGIPINYYAWVGLDGFIKVINEVGGVDVDVLHPIVDDDYPDDVGANANNPYAVKRLYLAPGPQHLDGPTALEYVRSRHADLVGDFGRSARQQQVLGALKTKLANPDIFGHLSNIANDLQGYLKTDMQLPDVLKLMNFARSLDPNKIQKLTLGPPYSSSGVAPAGTPDAGADVVFPDCTKILPAITQMLQLGNNAACNVEANSGGTTNQPLSYTLPPAYTNSAPVPGMDAFSDNISASLGNAPGDLFGLQSLLDLMLMGVFESPNVF